MSVSKSGSNDVFQSQVLRREFMRFLQKSGTQESRPSSKQYYEGLEKFREKIGLDEEQLFSRFTHKPEKIRINKRNSPTPLSQVKLDYLASLSNKN